jgi:tetratricopeptide (TPR) repeat protein
MRLKIRLLNLIFLLGLFCLPLSRTSGQSFPQWGSLKPGDYAVGFRHIQKYDYSRQVKPATDFTGASTGETAYPIQIGIWYPANKPSSGLPLTYEDFMLLELKRESFTPITPADRERVRDNVKSTAGLPALRLTVSDDVVKQTLETPTASFKDARPAPGRFPVILLSGTTITTATVLCEYLASHGYVVMAVPTTDAVIIRQATKPQFAIDDSVRALEYLTAEAYTLPFAEPSKLAVIGVNYNSMGALIYQMRNMRAQAVVSINGWETMRPNNERIFAASYLDRIKMRVPYLNFHLDQPQSGPADLSLIASLKYSERFLLVVDGLDHFGLINNPLAFPFSGTKRKSGYEFLVRSVESFLDRYIKGVISAEQFLRTKPEAQGFATVVLKTDWKQSALPPVPSDTEFAEILWTQKDVARATKVYREARAANPEVQLFGENELDVYIFRFDRLGRKDDVIAVRQLIAEAYPNSFNTQMNLGEALLRAGRPEESEKAYDKASEIGLTPGASNRGVVYFNLGCGYSRLGKKEKALKALEKAVAEGFANRSSYETEAALAPLRAEPRFQQLLAQLPKS